jgi:hypothetical protein
MNKPQITIRISIIWFEINNVGKVRNSFIIMTYMVERISSEIIGVSIVGINFDGPTKFRNRFLIFLRINIFSPQVVMRIFFGFI